MSNTLPELTNKRKSIADLAEDEIDELGFLTEPTRVEYEAWTKALMQKVDNYVLQIKGWESELGPVEYHLKAIQAKKKRLENQIERLKHTAEICMLSTNETKLQGEYHKIYLRESCSVDVVDIGLVPGEFLVTKHETNVDKMKVKERLGSGLEVPGCELKVKHSVQVK